MSLLRQLNDTLKPGFMLNGVWDTSYNALGQGLFFPTNDITNPNVIPNEFGLRGGCAVFGKGRFILTTFSANGFVYHVWDGMSKDTKQPKPSVLDPAASDENWPGNIAYANSMFMTAPYNATARNGDIQTSSDGWTWTVYTDVLPSVAGFWYGPYYNASTGRWITMASASGSFYSSTDGGATWSSRCSNPNGSSIGSMAYGNNRWVYTDPNYLSPGRVWTSTNDGSSWSSVNLSGFNYVNHVTWNDHDSQFVAVGGAWGGDVYARISTSPDGVTWTARLAGSDSFVFRNVIGDNTGKYIALGAPYVGGTYVATNLYWYSTNSGVTWQSATMPITTWIDPGRHQRLAFGDIRQGL
tara:strand:- start:1232 stop:2293 length:1062 start_codon:yes stop_codon:yes gene_type:complete